MTAQVN